MIRLENVLKISFPDVSKILWRRFRKMSWRRLQNILKTFWQDVLKTFWRCLEISWRRLEEVWPRRIYCSWPRRLKYLLKMSSEDVRLTWTYSSWSRRLEEDEDERRLQDVFKTSSSRRMFAGLIVTVSFSFLRLCFWVL